MEIKLSLPELHATQKIAKAEAGRFNMLVCGRRWGKTEECKDLQTETLLDGAPVAYMTPTYKMLSNVWNSTVELLHPITRRKDEQERRIETITNGVLDMWSLDNPDAIRGRAYKRVIIDEAASVKDLGAVWNAIVRPTLIDYKGDAWFPSTPKGHNDYYKLWLLCSGENKDWIGHHYTSYDNPYLDPNELDAMRKTMTELEYRQEILAEFLVDEGTVFRYIEQAMNAPVATLEEHAGHVKVAGVDWGQQDDFTVISVGCVNCMREIDLDRFNQIDYAFQRQRLMAMLHKWGVKRTVAEANAMGSVVIESLQRDGVVVTPFSMQATSKAPLIEGLALAIEQGMVQFLPNKVGITELEAYERKVTQTGLRTYSAPKGMHDDTVIARALMYRAVQTTAIPRVQEDYMAKRREKAMMDYLKARL